MAGTTRVITMVGTSYNNERDNRFITMTWTTRIAITVHNMQYKITPHTLQQAVHAVPISVFTVQQLLAAPSRNRTNDRPTDQLSAPLLLARTHTHTHTHTHTSNCLPSNIELHQIKPPFARSTVRLNAHQVVSDT
jgi:hypothetical protein